MDVPLILVAEDERDIRELIVISLQTYGLANVIEAHNGEEAITQAKTHKPALILMDVRMPKMTGYEACKQLKEDPNIVEIAVVENAMALKHASELMRGNSQIVSLALQSNGLALEFATFGLKKCRELVIAAVQQNGLALKYSAKQFKQDCDVVLIAVKKNGLALEFASDSLRADVNVVQRL